LGAVEIRMRRRTTVDQLSLFVLGAVAFGQVSVTLLAADIVLGRHVAFDLTWAVGLSALLSVPCYLLGFQSLKLNGRPARWAVRFGVALVLVLILLYASTVALLNIYGS
jgi:hypothetical protein